MRNMRNIGIFGTGVDGTIPVIRTKLVGVFATRFSPELDVSTLSSYLSEKLRMRKRVTCWKIDSYRNGFSSFQVTAECNEVSEIYDPQLWPAGIYVCCYFEAHRVNMDGVALESGMPDNT